MLANERGDFLWKNDVSRFGLCFVVCLSCFHFFLSVFEVFLWFRRFFMVLDIFFEFDIICWHLWPYGSCMALSYRHYPRRESVTPRINAQRAS